MFIEKIVFAKSYSAQLHRSMPGARTTGRISPSGSTAGVMCCGCAMSIPWGLVVSTKVLPDTTSPQGIDMAHPQHITPAVLPDGEIRPVVRAPGIERWSWALYDFANTIFSMNIATLYFSAWIVADLGS